MSVTANLFANAFDQAFSGNINWASDTIKMALLTSSASPSLSAWKYYSDLTNEVAAGNGYSTGGVALASPTHTVTAANSWGTSWAASTAYAAGALAIPTTPNGYLYAAVVAGSSGASQPSWPTVVGESVSDGTVTWTCLGESVTVWSSASASWTVPATDTLAFQYAVIYDAQTGTGSTEPLIAVINYGSTQSIAAPSSGTATLTVSPPSNPGGWFISSPA